MTEPAATPSARPAAGWAPLSVAFAAAFWIASVGNWPLWRALLRLPELATPRGAVFIAGFGAMVLLLTGALLALFAWRRTIKPVAAVVIVSAAIGAHFMGVYGIVLDPSMMTSVLQTDSREAGDLLDFRFVLSLLLLAVLPLALLWRLKVRPTAPGGQAWRNAVAVLGALVLLAALIATFFADLSATMRNHRSLRYLINPVNAYFSLGVIAKQATARPTGPLLPIGADARVASRPAGAKPPLLVLVVGETARADHFALNGYARPTNPELSAADVVSFARVTSCGTNTAASLPCMFSALDKRDFEARDRDHENLLDLVQRAGLAVLWIDNQSGCKGLCDRVPHVEAIESLRIDDAPAFQQLCNDGECLDAALLRRLDERLAGLPAERRARGVLIVLHQMGSHGPAYFRRSPTDRKPFQPECATTVLQDCRLADVVNAYDNSIAYTDHVLSETIRWLERQREAHAPALLYVSDHGESLGEKNIFLHGLPYAIAPQEQTHVPMLTWLDGRPDGAREAACLRQRAATPLSHDHLFHTVLGLLDVEATEYRAPLDAFAPCRRP